MVIITGANGGIGYELLIKALEAKQLCMAVTRDKNQLNNRFSQQDSKFVLANYFEYMDQIKATIAIQPVDQIQLVLNAFDILPIKKAAKLSSVEIQNNINFNIITQLEIITQIVELSKLNNIVLSIIQISSGAAYRAIEGWSLYCAGKAYLNMFLQTICKEEAIQLVLYDPGVVDTEMQRKIRMSNVDDFEWVLMFQSYKKDKVLHLPKDVAHDILQRYILKWTATNLQENMK